MAEQLSWTREGERLSLHGELDQDFLVPLWDARNDATQGVSVIDLSGLSRVDTAGLALLVHLVELIRSQGRTANLEGVSEKVATLKGLYNLPEDMIP
ncbi:TPA: lipid asymmetry maintenance protein MlaB [Kluyvera cryocrescens]|uniref:lipid asymmetry maintenance protein MlaB n=1 Tax=Kluyvera cryocrescens TaxID=580 RepID=UPI0007744A3E|nr:lipid asymmetry maintenance protein MlaB [Kluyvera cryocrescens]MCX2866742.1 lipid asymmetry maintenance protein MlaB [Kluyvera cryocrescens]MDU5686130.1 lipid asymmetry maintenance protein MlaB [Kluyvera cryocrescens]MEB7714137.1 lipid asymmetry maintenance protein MlaB [Kluyvera cryocrescens]WNN72291.1 lipid asymmetry maintenance protein MlaB [Kluyvera cryocrescens]SQC32937.1 Probable phospholipid ABC transporter-binding protein mlaB [Kluyvera cryocrescens]